MELRLYLDTSIWMDYFEGRKGKHIDYGDSAFKLLIKVLSSEGNIIVSKILLKELQKFYSFETIMSFMKPFENILVNTAVSDEQVIESRMLSQSRDVPQDDALHAILSRDNNALLISRDRHFELLVDICAVATPEEII